jgi:hypothetical protein
LRISGTGTGTGTGAAGIQGQALAHHALAALALGDASEAIRIARQAAERARAQLAHEEAIALLKPALTTCEARGVSRQERAEVLLALGWATTEAGQLERGRALFRSAAELARSTKSLALPCSRAALGQGGEYVLAEIRGELVDVLREALNALGERATLKQRACELACWRALPQR